MPVDDLRSGTWVTYVGGRATGLRLRRCRIEITDRPETIDLMRRHIDQLAQDFRDLGFSDLSFSFGHDDSARYGGSDARQADITAAEPAAPTLVPIPSIPGRGPRGEPDGGIDLRL